MQCLIASVQFRARARCTVSVFMSEVLNQLLMLRCNAFYVQSSSISVNDLCRISLCCSLTLSSSSTDPSATLHIPSVQQAMSPGQKLSTYCLSHCFADTDFSSHLGHTYSFPPIINHYVFMTALKGIGIFFINTFCYTG